MPSTRATAPYCHLRCRHTCLPIGEYGDMVACKSSVQQLMDAAQVHHVCLADLRAQTGMEGEISLHCGAAWPRHHYLHCRPVCTCPVVAGLAPCCRIGTSISTMMRPAWRALWLHAGQHCGASIPGLCRGMQLLQLLASGLPKGHCCAALIILSSHTHSLPEESWSLLPL